MTGGGDMKCPIISVSLLVLLGVAKPPRAAIHYVSSDGTATWEQSVDRAAPCPLSTANATVNAGDTVYLLEGTYTDAYVKPGQSGTAENPMTREEVEEKSQDLLMPILGKDRALELIERIWNLEQVRNMRELRLLLSLPKKRD